MTLIILDSKNKAPVLLPLAEPPVTTPTTIRILGSINVTLDDRYCMGEYCNDRKRGNYTFYVPVSSSMPHIPLEVQFS